jgi:HEPN domain-containing protein
MKNHDDLAHAWWRKGESDLTNARMCLAANQVLDTACFHAQQAAEKYLKVYMSFNKIEFPFIHNLEKLVEICAARDPEFSIIKERAQSLTPFAVEARYDENFWPDTDTAREAICGAEYIRQFIADRLPKSFCS